MPQAISTCSKCTWFCAGQSLLSALHIFNGANAYGVPGCLNYTGFQCKGKHA